jgi:hypothetical protein
MERGDILTLAFFTRRLGDLCLKSGLSGLPRDEISRHVLFTSMVATLAVDAPLDQRAIDDRLARWIQASGIPELDHVTLRRTLVDAGYLSRPPDGSVYRVVAHPPGRPRCEAGVADADLAAILAARREEIARRKAAFLARPGLDG